MKGLGEAIASFMKLLVSDGRYYFESALEGLHLKNR